MLWRYIMYKFLMNMWKLNKLTESDVDMAVYKGIISADQGAEIKATAR